MKRIKKLQAAGKTGLILRGIILLILFTVLLSVSVYAADESSSVSEETQSSAGEEGDSEDSSPLVTEGDLEAFTELMQGADVFSWPLPEAYGTDAISSGYGYREGTYSGMHNGVDIACPEGTPIYACANGTVIISELSDSAGNWIVLDHGNGLYTEYMHMSERLMTVGDEVEKGETIGLVGSTGWSTGPHLHIGVSECEGGYSIYGRTDPMPYFSEAVSAIAERAHLQTSIRFSSLPDFPDIQSEKGNKK